MSEEKDSQDSLKEIPFSEWVKMWHQQARPNATGAFSHMPPIVAMETWFNSLEFDESFRQSDE